MENLREKAERALWAYDELGALIPIAGAEGPMDVMAEVTRLWLEGQKAKDSLHGEQPHSEAPNG